MSIYGIENVRGGSYVEIELSEFHIDALKMEIWAAKDLCTQCGRNGHFVKDCYAKKDASGNKIEYELPEVIPKKTRLSNNCIERTSFMRLANTHPDHQSEVEVVWILRNYIDKQMNYDKQTADMPIGTKYLPYAESIQKQLKIHYNKIQFNILYKTESQIIIRASWS